VARAATRWKTRVTQSYDNGAFSRDAARKTEIQYAAVLSTLGEKDLEKSSCAAEIDKKRRNQVAATGENG